MRFSRCEVRDHINHRKNDRWPSYRFCRELQWLKSPIRSICKIFGARRCSSFQHNRPKADMPAGAADVCFPEYV